MNDSRTPAPTKGTGAADKHTVPRSTDFGRRLRRHRRVCRELDQILEDLYGPPEYPRDVA